MRKETSIALILRVYYSNEMLSTSAKEVENQVTRNVTRVKAIIKKTVKTILLIFNI